eukprot:GHVL01024440.1.p1 GENE.GHVL01024440.1~~GHVL01024440.1.p1  ORF type:complete len:248 (+),score=31.21 GHVL01024440.1:55-798(+)
MLALNSKKSLASAIVSHYCRRSIFYTSTTAVLDRAVREAPYESRFDILKRSTKPVYMNECPGTPRQPYQKNLVDGIRIRSTYNPYVKITRHLRYQLDTWPSRDWERWDPNRCWVRGSRKRYNIPEDIRPYKDELGEWHPAKLSGRYAADVKKQYFCHGLPWIWKKDFYTAKRHKADSEPNVNTLQVRAHIRQQKVKEAMMKMDDMIQDYREEFRAKKPYKYLESAVRGLGREEIASQFFPTRKLPAF